MERKPTSALGFVWFLIAVIALAAGMLALARPALAAEAALIDSVIPSTTTATGSQITGSTPGHRAQQALERARVKT